MIVVRGVESVNPWDDCCSILGHDRVDGVFLNVARCCQQ